MIAYAVAGRQTALGRGPDKNCLEAIFEEAMNEAVELIESLAVVPVVAIDSVSAAHRLAEALIAGGLPCAEITLRTEAGLQVIKALSTGARGRITALTGRPCDLMLQVQVARDWTRNPDALPRFGYQDPQPVREGRRPGSGEAP